MIEYYLVEALKGIGFALLATAPFAIVIFACAPPKKLTPEQEEAQKRAGFHGGPGY